ncbi:MAG: hypothetical protein HY744_05810 [Deltaproteobacteria bacterium]|nr:hypothetical protein [Deltaproteobacteria bacterium]
MIAVLAREAQKTTKKPQPAAMVIVVGLGGLFADVWTSLSPTRQVIAVVAILVTVVFSVLVVVEEVQRRRKEAEVRRAEGREAKRAAVVLLEKLGARRINGRIEPNETQEFSGEAREQAAILDRLLQDDPELLARLDPEPEPEGIMEAHRRG